MLINLNNTSEWIDKFEGGLDDLPSLPELDNEYEIRAMNISSAEFMWFPNNVPVRYYVLERETGKLIYYRDSKTRYFDKEVFKDGSSKST